MRRLNATGSGPPGRGPVRISPGRAQADYAVMGRRPGRGRGVTGRGLRHCQGRLATQ